MESGVEVLEKKDGGLRCCKWLREANAGFLAKSLG